MVIKKNKKYDFFDYLCTSIFRKEDEVKLYKAYTVWEVADNKPLPLNLDKEVLSISPQCAAQWLFKNLSSEDRTKFAGLQIIVIEFTFNMDEIKRIPIWNEDETGEERMEWFGSFKIQITNKRQWDSFHIFNYIVSPDFYYEEDGDELKLKNLELEKTK